MSEIHPIFNEIIKSINPNKMKDDKIEHNFYVRNELQRQALVAAVEFWSEDAEILAFKKEGESDGFVKIQTSCLSVLVHLSRAWERYENLLEAEAVVDRKEQLKKQEVSGG